MNNMAGIRKNTLGVITGLVVSVGWIFMGLDTGFRFEAPDAASLWLTLGGHRHTIATLLALTLIPVCALEKRWAFLAAVVLGVVTLILSVVHIGYMLVATPPGYESQLFGPAVWSLIQVVIVVFGQQAIQEGREK
ncbi:MAG: hypothetical protein JXA25_16320 [Anaerolineales bacterium]|nr:hypothetical protein [Anaerolineales bacterium]